MVVRVGDKLLEKLGVVVGQIDCQLRLPLGVHEDTGKLGEKCKDHLDHYCMCEKNIIILYVISSR